MNQTSCDFNRYTYKEEVISMDTAALSMSLSEAYFGQSVGIELTKNVLDASKEDASQIIDMLQALPAPHPTLGKSIDIKG